MLTRKQEKTRIKKTLLTIRTQYSHYTIIIKNKNTEHTIKYNYNEFK